MVLCKKCKHQLLYSLIRDEKEKRWLNHFCCAMCEPDCFCRKEKKKEKEETKEDNKQ